MKFICIIWLHLCTLVCFSQDTLKTDSIEYKKNFLVFNGSLQYNIFLGERKRESFPGASATEYTNYTIENTYGGFCAIQYRHQYKQNISIQQGALFYYQPKQSVHNDSLKNESNSLLNIDKTIRLALTYTFYFNYKIQRFTLSSGLICPVLTYRYSYGVYEDKSTITYGKSIEWGKFYFSENIQYKIFKNSNLYLNVGVDISPKIYDKNNSDYKILLNGGIVYLVEKKSNDKKAANDNIK